MGKFVTCSKNENNKKFNSGLLHSSLALFVGNHAQRWQQRHQPRQPPLAHGQFALAFQLLRPFVGAACPVSYSPPTIVEYTS